MPDKHGIPSSGDEVIFLGRNGFMDELEYAKTIFTVGQVLTVLSTEVQNWHSSLKFEGVTGQQTSFNSVMFELVGEQPSDPSVGIFSRGWPMTDADRFEKLMTEFEGLVWNVDRLSQSPEGKSHWSYEGMAQRLDAKRQEIKDFFAQAAA